MRKTFNCIDRMLNLYIKLIINLFNGPNLTDLNLTKDQFFNSVKSRLWYTFKSYHKL